MKKTILILIFAIGLTATAQIEFAAYQDVKLATMEDDAGNKPLTADVVILAKFYNGGNRADNWSKQIFYLIDFEYANLNGGEYIRYSAGVGYRFDIWKLQLSPSIDYGIINRWDRAFSSFNGLIDLTYMLTPKFGVSALASLTQRQDLKWKYSDNKLVKGFYIGAKFLIN